MHQDPAQQPIQRTSRLAARARVLYLGIPAFASLLLLLISGLTFQTIADDSARRMARQYSIEAAANFQISANTHFVLMQQVSRSTTIAHWLANEEDPAAKALAFNEIMGYVLYSPDTRLMFTSYATKQGYDFHVDLTPQQFEPWGTLAGGEASQWFFDTRDAEMPFIINIQRERPELVEELIVMFMWSNHRVYYQGSFVGVVTVGFPFDNIFNAVFGRYDVNNMRGYILDRNGAVRADSAGLLRVAEYGLPTLPAIPEAADNPNLADHIYNHLHQINGGIFQPGTETAGAVSLSGGIYRYASIAPIIGTDWSVVVLSNHIGIFDGLRYLPLVLSAFSVLVLSVLVGNTLVRVAVLGPLHDLTQSAAEAANSATKSQLYGVDRSDEIGGLSRTIQFMRDSIHESQQELRHREQLLSTVNQAAEMLLSAAEEDTTQALIAGIEIVGQYLDVDRVLIWRNEMIDGELHFVLQYEWLSSVGKQMPENILGSKISYKLRPQWLEMFQRGESLNSTISQLPPDIENTLRQYGVVSVALLPLFLDKEFIGFFGVDDCVNERVFTNDEMHILASAGLMFTSVLNRMEQTRIRREMEQEREANALSEVLLQSSPIIINIWDDALNLIVTSQQSVKMFGLSNRDEYIERFSELSPRFQPCGTLSSELAITFVKQAFETGYVQFEWMHQTLDGELIPTEITLARFVRQGKQAVAAYTVDLRTAIKSIEANKRAEQAEEESRAKTRFLARMSHELRTPLNSILGAMVIVLQRDEFAQDTREALNLVYSSAHLLLALINDILDLAKVEAGKMEIVLAAYDTSGLIADTIQLNLMHVGDKKINFKLTVDEDLPAKLFGDELRIKQILNNLLSNAFKYTESGEVS
ncbi:MAG: GAF domain-containing protein, partial [Defluviitaleaceae bacterium]|nr:GAF domain-containing protein [Defluviitaleaceae bacterium]